MTDRLRQALDRITQESALLSPAEQDALAVVLAQIPIPLPPFAGSIPDMPDDSEEEILQRRREVPPSPPIEEQLRGLMDDDA
jgi:hypothetical protein